MKKGRALEKLVSAVESALAGQDNLTVESPKKLRDKITKRFREHDVVITFNQGHHIVTIAIECRDRSRPVGVPEIEAFSTKCKNTGVNLGIIVSSNGFFKSAIKNAHFYSLQCLTLKEASSFDWLQCTDMNVIIYLPRVVRIEIKGDGNVLKSGETDFDLILAGKVLTQKDKDQIINSCLYSQLEDLYGPTSGRQKEFHLRPEGLFAKKHGSEKPIAISDLFINIEYDVVIEKRPIILKKYFDKGNDKKIADIATVNLKGIPGTDGDIVLAVRENVTRQISHTDK